MTHAALEKLIESNLNLNSWPSPTGDTELGDELVAVIEAVSEGATLESAGQRAGVLSITLAHWLAIAEHGGNVFSLWLKLCNKAHIADVDRSLLHARGNRGHEKGDRTWRTAQAWACRQADVWEKALDRLRDLSPQGRKPNGGQRAEIARIVPECWTLLKQAALGGSTAPQIAESVPPSEGKKTAFQLYAESVPEY